MTVFLGPYPNTQGFPEVGLPVIPFMPTKDAHIWLLPPACQLCQFSLVKKVLIQAGKQVGWGLGTLVQPLQGSSASWTYTTPQHVLEVPGTNWTPY